MAHTEKKVGPKSSIPLRPAGLNPPSLQHFPPPSFIRLLLHRLSLHLLTFSVQTSPHQPCLREPTRVRSVSILVCCYCPALSEPDEFDPPIDHFSNHFGKQVPPTLALLSTRATVSRSVSPPPSVFCRCIPLPLADLGLLFCGVCAPSVLTFHSCQRAGKPCYPFVRCFLREGEVDW